jgi:Asp/Glu/hydantoin racemase
MLPLKIWFQVVASEKRLPAFLKAVEQQCRQVASPGTTIDVNGTVHGALGEHFKSIMHYDENEILRIAHQRVRGRGYAAYAMGNSLDPGMDALREMLDVPVLSLMQVACSVAPMLGDKFGIMVPNAKFVPTFRDMVDGYGLTSRLAGIAPLTFDRLADHNALFLDDAAGRAAIERIEEVAQGLVAQGAEVVMAAGPTICLLHKHRVHELAGAVVLDSYSTLVKVAEAMAFLAAECGVTTSRHLRYRQPDEGLLREALEAHEVLSTSSETGSPN